MVSSFSRLPSLILATRMVGQGCGKSRRNWGKVSVFQKMAAEVWWWKVQPMFSNAEYGIGGDDAADALRYLVATKPRTITQRKLRGF